MRISIIFISLFSIPILCFTQLEKRAECKDIEGVILFRFVPDTRFEGCYCSLKSKILIDSTVYDFVSQDFNYSIIQENKELEESLGGTDAFYRVDFLTNFCLHNPNHIRLKNFNCDSLINVFSLNNIYDPLLYKLDYSKHMTMTILSNSIYSSEDSDTIYIAIDFRGRVIQYENIIYGEQSDYRIITNDEGVKIFDASHGSCPFEKYDSTIIVLNEVYLLNEINNRQQDLLKLKTTELKKIEIFLYE